MKQVAIATYGVKLEGRPQATDCVISCLNIPNVSRNMTRAEMMQAPGFPACFASGMEKILSELRHKDRVAVGVHCAYGQHRSPAMAALLSDALASLGIEVAPTVHIHRDA